jgi:hypothetical protein
MRVPKFPKERMSLRAVQQIELPGVTSPSFKIGCRKIAAMPEARSVIEIFRNSSGLTLAKGVQPLFNWRTILRATGEIRSFSLFDDCFNREVMIDGTGEVSNAFGKEEFLVVPELPIGLKFPDFREDVRKF